MAFGRTLRAVSVAASLGLSARAALAQDEPAPAPAPAPAEEPATTPAPPPSPPAAPDVPASPLPAAPTPARFGDRGELVVTADSSISISSTAYSVFDAKYFYAAFSPGFDYFIVRGVSLGLDAGVSYANAKGYVIGGLAETTTTTVSAGARVGVNVPLSDAFSLYPRLTLGAETVSREITLPLTTGLDVNAPVGGVPRKTTTGGAFVTAFVPILLHPARHLFVGAGPGVSHELGNATGAPALGGPRTTVFGRLVVGGWWGGDEVPTSEPSSSSGESAAATTHAARFGDKHQWVFSGDLSGGVNYTKFTGSAVSSTTVELSPAADYFPVSRLSVGLGGIVGHSTLTGSTDERLVIKSTRVGGDVRVGVDLPIASSLSFYPRASIGVFHDVYTRYDPVSPDEKQQIEVAVALYAPLLAHVAPHFFAGFGPIVLHDLLNNDQKPGAVDNLATRIGARLVVGGWL